MNFENKTAVITGGSRGIGLAIAKKLAAGGANIAILYVGDETEGRNAVEQLAQYNTKVAQYFCDVSDFEASKKVVDTVLEDFGGIDILINNAGITRDKLVLNMDEKDAGSSAPPPSWDSSATRVRRTTPRQRRASSV